MDGQLILHEDARSGNCYKIRLTAAHLALPLLRRDYDILAGETRTPEFLSMVNANGRIPVLQIGERLLPESNAACFWLADGSHLIPADRFDRADMLRWMFWEQYNHEPNVATLRFWRVIVGDARMSDAQRELIPSKMTSGEAALRLMDELLATREWLAGSDFSLADITLYAYTHVADEGGFDLATYPQVQAWLSRVAHLPGHVLMSA